REKKTRRPLLSEPNPAHAIDYHAAIGVVIGDFDKAALACLESKFADRSEVERCRFRAFVHGQFFHAARAVNCDGHIGRIHARRSKTEAKLIAACARNRWLKADARGRFLALAHNIAMNSRADENV